jgi:predicted nucleic acid-binding protein
MSGIKFLLDTNIVIGLLKQGQAVLPNNDITIKNSAVSQITRIELLVVLQSECCFRV